MATTGSISVSGLLGGTAGSIDVTSLVSSLMQAESVPKNLLTDQLNTVSAKLAAYQTINTKLTAVQNAARDLAGGTAGVTAWQASAATSSNPAVAATATSKASPSSTTFDVVRLAASQVSTVAVPAGGSVADPAAGITITGADGTAHPITLTSGAAKDVAAAINAAGVGVRASVIATDQGDQLQVTSSRTGAANGFTLSGFTTAPRTLVAAADAQLAVGGANGYTVSSATNTFSGVIPGVSFSVSAPATGVTITVGADTAAITKSVQALVTAANSARTELANDSAQGALLQGAFDVRSLASALGAGVSKGTSTGGSLKTYGIDVDRNGVITFDATVFAAAYADDPAATQAAVGGSFAAGLQATATAAVDDETGTITQSVKGLTTTGQRLSAEIDDWTTRLADIQTAMQAKYAAMQSALARLQTQQNYMTSVLNSATNSKDSGS